MIDGLLIFLGGLLGSSHCVGMCGGFVLSLGTNRYGWWTNLLRQVVYASGRISTYALGGAAAGYAGLRLSSEFAALVNAQALLCIVAGLLLIIQGVQVLGWFPRRATSNSGTCFAASLFGGLLRAENGWQVFLAGLANGLLPCGLVYAYLALAGSSGDLFRGAAIMTLFGLGTAPLLVLVGCGGSLLSLAWRRPLFRIAAWCVVLTGAVSVLRGLGFVQWSGTFGPPVCPHCR